MDRPTLVVCACHAQLTDQFDFLRDWEPGPLFLVDISAESKPDLVMDVRDPDFLDFITPGQFHYIVFIYCPGYLVFVKGNDVGAYTGGEFDLTLLRHLVQKLPIGGSLLFNNLTYWISLMDDEADRSEANVSQAMTQCKKREQALFLEIKRSQHDPDSPTPLLHKIERWLESVLPGTLVTHWFVDEFRHGILRTVTVTDIQRIS